MMNQQPINANEMLAWSQTKWKDYIQKRIKEDDQFAKMSVIAVYENQSGYEKALHGSVDKNGVGFSRWDAQTMSDFAVAIKAGIPLTGGQMNEIRHTMPKYWKQVMKQVKHWLKQEKAANIFLRDAKSALECLLKGEKCKYARCEECCVKRLLGDAERMYILRNECSKTGYLLKDYGHKAESKPVQMTIFDFI